MEFHFILRTDEFMSARAHQSSLSGQKLEAREMCTIDDMFLGTLLNKLLQPLSPSAPWLQGSCAEFHVFFQQAPLLQCVSALGYRSRAKRILVFVGRAAVGIHTRRVSQQEQR